jgi:predicted SnoaL-like aldol condensation-catalyzing enzyme
MSKTTPEKNKALVLEAFDTLFNRRDYGAAERFWSDRYIQHSAHIAPGRDGLFNLTRTLPDTLKYENQLIVAEGDYVIAHGRFSGNGRPAAWIAADIARVEDGRLAEHWDVLQEEATKARSASGLPMFGDQRYWSGAPLPTRFLSVAPAGFQTRPYRQPRRSAVAWTR